MATRKTLDVHGMHCEKCVARVKNALEGVEGVHAARVNLEKENAIVKLDTEVADEVLVTVVNELGFEAKMA